MTSREALDDLLSQHSELRQLMDLCELLADQLDAGQIEPDELTREVMHLRGMFDSHTRFEEQFLRPILREANLFGSPRLEVMLEQHARDHRTMQMRIAPGITAELRLTISTLRSHLELEEDQLVSAAR